MSPTTWTGGGIGSVTVIKCLCLRQVPGFCKFSLLGFARGQFYDHNDAVGRPFALDILQFCGPQIALFLELILSLGEQISAELPFLRRYARALSGSQASGDAMVKATLEAALGDPSLKQSLGGGRIVLYRIFHTLLEQNAGLTNATAESGSGKEAAAMRKLDAIADSKRQALLLTTVEEFSPLQAAEIMGLEVDVVEGLAADAIAQIDSEQKTSVLIIEDEPMIQMQLEDLVESLDHSVCGTAATRAEASEAVANERPGLVLADIQLADGSSGLDAVEEILALGRVPVVFITAYPERLLTGDRLEPTYLVTKPFREQNVKAAISQALFFG